MKNIFSLFLFLFLIGCNETGKQQQATPVNETPSKTDSPAVDTVPRWQYATISGEDRESSDSIRIAKVFKECMDYALQHKNKGAFKHEFETMPDDSSFEVTAQLEFGNIFDPNRKHLIIRNIVAWGAECSIFILENNKFKQVCEKQKLGITFLGDTLMDINGDGYKDYSVHTYPTSGCCRRDVYEVFLYQSRSGRFTKDYYFINPTFYPKEKIIRGVEYGHPGEVGLYKYRWNGLRVDTLEFVYPYARHGGKFIRTRKREYRPGPQDGQVLGALPTEYRKIKSIDYFLSY